MTRRGWLAAWAAGLRLEVKQITQGPLHHFFGYIGHVGNTPWSAGDQRMVFLETGFHERMPEPGQTAGIVLREGERLRRVEQTRAWNFQQGTMFYWNPAAAGRELIFNDRDAKTQQVFTVLYDVERRKRLHEFRFAKTPFGNGGVCPAGGWFCGLNYGRMARLRPVTGYPGAFDWNARTPAPDDDGLFRVDLATGKERLLVSFRQLGAAIGAGPDRELFINHSLINRAGDRIYFYVRADFETPGKRVDVPCTIRPDGTGLTVHETHIGGHPEWESARRMIGSREGRMVLYDVDEKKVVETVGTKEAIPDPGGDTALSPDGRWIANGFRRGAVNHYVVLRRGDGAWAHSRGFDVQGWTGGPLRIDGAPCWNRAGNAIAFTAFSEPDRATRQMWVARVHGG